MAMSRTAFSQSRCSQRGEQRRGLRAHVGEHEPRHLADRVTGDLHLLLETSVRVHRLFKGLLDALAGLVHHPAVVHAAEAVLLGDAVGEVDAAVGAEAVDETHRAGLVAVEDEVFAEESHRLGGALDQFGAGGDGVPVAPHEFAHRSSGADLRQLLVLLYAQHRVASFELLSTAASCS